MSSTTDATPANFRLIYPNLFIALKHDYSGQELGYNFVVMLGDTNSMRLFRGHGNTPEEATQDAIWKYEVELYPN